MASFMKSSHEDSAPSTSLLRNPVTSQSMMAMMRQRSAVSTAILLVGDLLSPLPWLAQQVIQLENNYCLVNNYAN
jgi:hypothetical protein